jgi:hypothetical protein
MGPKTSTTQQMFRQRSSLSVAAICAVTSVILLVSMALDWADHPQPLFASWVLLVVAGTWSVFVRPAVLLDVDGVTVRNILRDIQIPWSELTHAESRWNLKVFAGDRGYTAWAISAQIGRPSRPSGGRLGMLSPRRLEKQYDVDRGKPAAAPKVTASTVATAIEQAKREYDEVVAQGRPPEEPEGRLRITWVPLVMVVLLLPAIAVVAASIS